MSELKIFNNKNSLSLSQDEFISSLMTELQEWDSKVEAKDLASTIKSLLSAKTMNNAWIEMDDNRSRLDTVKLVLQLNGVKTWNTLNVNLFNIQKPWKDETLYH